jgi:hypothetical protein
MIAGVQPDSEKPVRGPVRRAGHAELGDGATVTWTVSEGTKGRRWREVAVRGGAVVHSLLLETFPDGRFAHLELSTAAGLLTLHPEGDGSLHGNAVSAEGVVHVVGLPWPDGSVVLVEGSRISSAAAAGIDAHHAVVVGLNLSVDERPVESPDFGPGVDRDGLPVIEGGASWPLELEDGGRDQDRRLS